MGLLDQVIGGVVGQVFGGGRGGRSQGGLGDVLSSPVVRALLMLLVSKAASGGLGDIFGGGGGGGRTQPAPAPQGRRPEPGGDEGDLGGFGQSRDAGAAASGDVGGGEFSDLSGMLDGPGERGAGRGPYAHLDREPRQDDAGNGSAIGGGLGGLIQSFERSGLGDVIGSWIGHGGNRQIAPNRLADALGPDTVDTLSRQTGLSHDDLLQQLAQALPAVIDQLTPHGRPPNEAEQRDW